MLFLLRRQSALLAPEDVRRAAGQAREKDQQIGLNLSDGVAPAQDWVHGNRFIGVELDEVQAAESGGVLVLFADRFAAALDLNLRGLACQLVGAGVALGISMENVQQAHGKAARAAQTSAARGNVGDGRDLDAPLDFQKPHRFARLVFLLRSFSDSLWSEARNSLCVSKGP